MIGRTYPNLSFQTFYLSKEICNCPLITDIVRVIKNFKTIGLLKKISQVSISMKYGKRILINSKNSDFNDLKAEDFLEIVDYDPLKRVLLVMGPKEPRNETPVHWMIHHARDEVNVIIQIFDEQLYGQLDKKLSQTDKKYPINTIEQVKEILLKLRDSKNVLIKDNGVIIVGNNMKEVEDSVKRIYEELK